MARLYSEWCPICGEKTTWCHDDMSPFPRPDKCQQCGKSHWDWSSRTLTWPHSIPPPRAGKDGAK